MRIGLFRLAKMGIKQIPLKKFIKWLESQGLELQKAHSKHSSHVSYNYPKDDERRLSRPIIVRPNYKDIPLLHIHTNLQTLGISKSDFEKEIENF